MGMLLSLLGKVPPTIKLAAIICFSFISTVSAQGVVGGVVLDAQTREPVPGVRIGVKGSNKNAVANSAGLFSIEANPTDVLIFNSLGYEVRELVLTRPDGNEIFIHPSQSKLDEVVVIGYGVVTKADLTGAVGQANIEDMNKAPVSNFVEALAGRVAGVQVISGDGQPGGGLNIVVRGAGSLTQSSSPLFVVDGFPVEDLDPATLNRDDIESLTVLKDASSTAIYGSRAANGVVLIETKRGKVGKPVVSFNTYSGAHLQGRQIELMSPYEFVKYQSELYPTVQSTIAYFQNGKTLEDYRNETSIDWPGLVMTNGKLTESTLSVRGGNANTRYALSGAFFDQEGIVINTGSNRYNARFTLDQVLSPRFNTGITASYAEVNREGAVINTAMGSVNPSSYALFRTWGYRPIGSEADFDLVSEAVDDAIGDAAGIRFNPYVDLMNQDINRGTNTVSANGYLEAVLSKSLRLRSTAGIYRENLLAETFYNSNTIYGSPLNVSNINGINGSIANTIINKSSNENLLTWNTTFNKNHKIRAMGLFSVAKLALSQNGYTGTQLPNEELGIDGLDEGAVINPRSSRSVNTLMSYATRWNYDYKSKYLFTFTFRADGSSKFRQKWGYFPGVAFAWNMHKESLLEDLIPQISNSKLRLSYGSTGNNRIGDFERFARLTQSLNDYSLNNQGAIGSIYVSSMGNADLRWEKTNLFDIGYELGLFRQRLTFEVDLYRKLTNDLLLGAILPPSMGFLNATKNIGRLKNEGLELTIEATPVKYGNFMWKSNFNISFNRNTILELADDEPAFPTVVTFEQQFGRPLYLAQVGQPMGQMVGYIWEGNYQYEHFDNTAPGVYTLKPEVPSNGNARETIQPGDIKYRDINGDGVINDYDIAVIGRGQPIHIGGFSNNFTYKGFDLNVFFQWSYGNDVYNANRLTFEGNSNLRILLNQFASYEDRWTPDNQVNTNFRTGGVGPAGAHSSRVVEDASYLRLKTVSLSYSFPRRLVQRLYLTNFSLNAAAQNLFTWTNYTGMDPEVSTRDRILSPGFDFSAYPQARTIVVGLKATF